MGKMAEESKEQREAREWRTAIGTAMVSFAQIEQITYKCLAHLPRDKIADTASQLGFARRIGLILEILNGRENRPTEVEKFINLLEKAKRLSEVRNTIAHNPIVLNVSIHALTGDVLADKVISSARGGEKVIDLESAKEFAAEVESLASELLMAIAKIAELKSVDV